ncbi:MAG TPA: sugar transferase, partial [Gemmatimonadales bacterium]
MGTATSGVRRAFPSRSLAVRRSRPAWSRAYSRTLARVGRALPQARDQWLNRSVNVLLAVVALVIVSPVLVIVALLVKLTSRGPVFYTQERVGL